MNFIREDGNQPLAIVVGDSVEFSSGTDAEYNIGALACLGIVPKQLPLIVFQKLSVRIENGNTGNAEPSFYPGSNLAYDG